MKKLSDMFTSKAGRLHQAVARNDLAGVEALMAKKISLVIFELFTEETFKTLSKEMAQLFVDKIDQDVFARWTVESYRIDDAKQSVSRMMLSGSFTAKRYDLVEMLLDGGMTFNSGKGHEHLAGKAIEAEAPAADRLRWLKKMLSGGYDKIENPDALPLLAVQKDFPEAVGLFAALGFDLHKNSETLLRAAVKERLPGMCRYLLTEQGADPEAVLRPARELGLKEDEKFLLAITETLPPKPLPTTLESALAEVQALRATVRDLCEKVEGMQTPEKTLDKPGLVLPKGNAP